MSKLIHIDQDYKQLLYNQANANLPQVGAEIQTLVSAVPWGHHKYIMDKCSNDTKKALFYVRQT